MSDDLITKIGHETLIRNKEQRKQLEFIKNDINLALIDIENAKSFLRIAMARVVEALGPLGGKP